MSDDLESLRAENQRLRKEIEDAKNDLRSFMTSFVREHFFDNDGWKPLPDLLGMLSQMDNASTVARTYRDRADASKACLSEAVKVMESIAAHEPGDGSHNLNDLIAHASVNAAKSFLANLKGAE